MSIILPNANGALTTIEPGNGTKNVTLQGNDIVASSKTIAEFRARTDRPNNVHVTGYHTENDGAFGSHFFKYMGTDSDNSEDNGGTIIVTDSLDRYELQYDSAVNVKWFGVKGNYNYDDGSGQDDTTILKAVFNAFRDVYLPEGSYLCNSKIGLIPQNVKISGYSYATTRLIVKDRKGTSPYSSATAINYAFIGLQDRCIFENIGFDYPDNYNPNTINEYPVTIVCQGYYGQIQNIDLYNSFYGIWTSGAGWMINDIIGAPLNTGIYFYEIKDVPKVYTVHFNKNIDFNVSANRKLGTVCYNYIAANGVAYRFGRVDFTDFKGLFCYGYNKGIYAKTDIPGSLNSCSFIDCHMDICTNPIDMYNWQDRINFIGCTLTSIANTNTGCIISGGVFPDIMSFTNCFFKNYGGAVIQQSNSVGLTLNFETCGFKNYNLLNGGYKTISNAGEVYTNIFNCSISSPLVTNNDCDFVYSTGTGRITIKNSVFDRGSNNGKLINATDADMTAYDNIHKSGNGNIYNTRFSYARMGSVQFASQAPTAGDYTESDIVFNSDAAAGGKVGWVCTDKGNPGTWKAFGVIDS